MIKQIVLCADDYGQNNAISQAIIELLTKKRLSAVSCMTTATDWPSRAKALSAFAEDIDMGLHFNLTEGRLLTGLAPWNLSVLLMKSLVRQLGVAHIAAELHAQIDQFIAGTGKLPDFIDGHQHVHQLPIVRDAVIKVYEARFARGRSVYVRSLSDIRTVFRPFHTAYLKRLVIQLSGAFFLQSQLIAHAIPHNTSFAGVYTFANSSHYQQFFIKFLKQVKQNGLIMCHPGKCSDNDDDPIARARQDEYQFLMSEQFTKLCQLHQIYLIKFQQNHRDFK